MTDKIDKLNMLADDIALRVYNSRYDILGLDRYDDEDERWQVAFDISQNLWGDINCIYEKFRDDYSLDHITFKIDAHIHNCVGKDAFKCIRRHFDESYRGYMYI